MGRKSNKKRGRHIALKTLGAATTLLACGVQVLGGMMVGARTSRILFRCGLTSISILMFFAVVLWIMTRYEETQSGKA